MENTTKVEAVGGKQELLITRQFDLPVDLLFKAYEDPEIVEQWMNTTVLKMEPKKHGSYRIETKDPKGKVAFRASGVYHEFEQNKTIIRTFEMEGSPFGVQLEFLEFETLPRDKSKLIMHIVFRSVDARDQLLKLPFAMGLNTAHNRIQEILNHKQ